MDLVTANELTIISPTGICLHHCHIESSGSRANKEILSVVLQGSDFKTGFSVIMPSTHKKTPPTAMQKKTMASARAKVNLTKKSKKKQQLNCNGGSCLDESSATGSNHVN